MYIYTIGFPSEEPKNSRNSSVPHSSTRTAKKTGAFAGDWTRRPVANRHIRAVRPEMMADSNYCDMCRQQSCDIAAK